MARLHPDREHISRFFCGELPVADNRRVVLHLLSGCSSCRTTAQGLWPAAGSRAYPTLSDYDGAFRRVAIRVRDHADSLAAEHSAAPSLLARLQAHPFERCLVLVRNSRRFQTWALCELALREAFNAGFSDPQLAGQLGELGVAIADTLDPNTYGGRRTINDLKARALATLGNARRILSDFHAAEDAFDSADAHLAEGTGDPLERARLLDLLASLRSAQRRFTEALRCLDGAISIYRRLGERHLVGCMLINKGNVLGKSGDPKQAVEVVEEGLRAVDRNRDPRRLLAAKHNLVLYLHELGQLERAEQLLLELRPAYFELGDELNVLRLRWLEGLLHKAKGHLDSAATAFLEVKDGFAQRDMHLDVALASLDLAAIYAEQGRPAQVREVARQMLAVFSALSIHREALASLILLKDATVVERSTLRLIAETAEYLRRLRGDSHSSFLRRLS